MPHIYVCFLWHMHQPFYKDLVSGEYKLPWTRMHALKDYYGMVKVLEDFPDVHQTFNLVPSMLVQIEEYASGPAVDPFLRAALKPGRAIDGTRAVVHPAVFLPGESVADDLPLSRATASCTICGFRPDEIPARASATLRPPGVPRSAGALSTRLVRRRVPGERSGDSRDWFAKGRDFTLDDQQLLGRKQIEVCGKVIPVYREFAARGQIEVSTTPFYHPILPLICDSQIAEVAHPYVPLPSRFRYPEDAAYQLRTARTIWTTGSALHPTGLWPSEGSVSDEALHLAAEMGSTGSLRTTACSDARCSEIRIALRNLPAVRVEAR